MELTIAQHIQTFFKNLSLNSTGARKDIFELLEDNKVDRVLSMMTTRDTDIDKAHRYRQGTEGI